MKIQGIKSQENKSDILELNGNDLNINGESQTLSEDSDIKIYVDQQHFFLFVNNNYLLFHDKDLNGEIDLVELKGLIDCYNLSEEVRKKEHLDYKATFTPEAWIAKRKACGQLK